MTRFAIVISMLAVAGSACAHDDFCRAGDPRQATRSVRIGMADTMRFVVRNNGKLKHEMVIGTIKVVN